MLNKDISEVLLALHYLVMEWESSNNDRENDYYLKAINILNKHLFGHNIGREGPMGSPGTCSAKGSLEKRRIYDKRKKGFVFYDSENRNIFVKMSDIPGDWSRALCGDGCIGTVGVAELPGFGEAVIKEGKVE